jgi:hypothetical protein
MVYVSSKFNLNETCYFDNVYLHVKRFVNSQSSGLTEAFSTFHTFERFFLRVDVSEMVQHHTYSRSEQANINDHYR